jgi:3-oxoacyl-[acyl-carrier protein] reductase
VDLGLRDKVALVTGASAGIGRGIARVLADEGATTVLVARRAALLETLATQISAAGARDPLVVTIDLTADDGPERAVDAAIRAFGRVDIVINNAGGSRPLPLSASEADWHEAMTLNFTAVRRVAQAALPGMLARGWGRIVNITGSLEPRAVNGANAAKAAVHVWAKGLACEVAARAVTVNCIGPGRIHSEQIDQKLHPTPESQAQFAAANIPAGYFGDVEDVAYTVAFLCSERARYVTGQSFYIDGGMHRSI